jgi:hypothetical protein
MYAHVHRPATDPELRVGRLGNLGCLRAQDILRIAMRAAHQLAIRRAPPDGNGPLVLHGAIKERLQLAPASNQQCIGDRLRQCVGHKGPPHIQVASEPSQSQPIHQG